MPSYNTTLFSIDQKGSLSEVLIQNASPNSRNDPNIYRHKQNLPQSSGDILHGDAQKHFLLHHPISNSYDNTSSKYKIANNNGLHTSEFIPLQSGGGNSVSRSWHDGSGRHNKPNKETDADKSEIRGNKRLKLHNAPQPPSRGKFSNAAVSFGKHNSDAQTESSGKGYNTTQYAKQNDTLQVSGSKLIKQDPGEWPPRHSWELHSFISVTTPISQPFFSKTNGATLHSMYDLGVYFLIYELRHSRRKNFYDNKIFLILDFKFFFSFVQYYLSYKLLYPFFVFLFLLYKFVAIITDITRILCEQMNHNYQECPILQKCHRPF